MSSTRRSTTGEFHQERFCSAPEFEGDVINGLAAAKRISIVKDPAVREILWYIQWCSLTRGRLQQLCDLLVKTFPESFGTPTLRKLKKGGDRVLTACEIKALENESVEWRASICSASDFLSLDDDEEDEPQLPKPHFLSEFVKDVEDALPDLPRALVRFCVDPHADISKGVWYFEDLLGCLTTLRVKFIAAAQERLADTSVTRKVNETLDFWYSRRRMVLVEGVAGIGRTATARAWCDSRAGLVRYVEIPSSSDDRSFFAAIARQLGIGCGVSFKAQQIKVRIEEMLTTSDLCLALDESQYLWGQAMRPRKTPDRLLWIKTAFDAGTPIALIAHTDFSKWQKHFVERTLWTDEQFERRLNRRVVLPTEHSREDMLKIARAHFPAGDSKSWKLLSAYALGTEKKQASGIVEALESARFRAAQLGKNEPDFEEIKAALIHDHGFLCEPLPDACTPIAKGVHDRRNPYPFPASRGVTDSKFPIQGGARGSRITTPVAA